MLERNSRNYWTQLLKTGLSLTENYFHLILKFNQQLSDIKTSHRDFLYAKTQQVLTFLNLLLAAEGLSA